MAEAALRSAQEAIAAVTDPSAATSPVPPPVEAGTPSVPSAHAEPAAYETPDLAPASTEPLPRGLDLLSDVNVDVAIELGRTRMLVEDVLRLAEGAVVELDKLAGDPVDIYVNQRLVARGEVLVLNDNFCIRVNDILDSDQVERDI
ncbi:MAG TPA: flagellar motor switch protein FliN [Phycisphaerales bacterium]|nr:flagellar motor switch protein FliN [Phycisphaerales bacterium]